MEYSLKREMTCFIFKCWNCRPFVFFSTTTHRVALSENSFTSTYLPTSPVLDGGTLSASRLLFRATMGSRVQAAPLPHITLIGRLASGSKSWEMHLLTSANRTQSGKGALPFYCPQVSPSSAPGQWCGFCELKLLEKTAPSTERSTFHCRDA